MKQKGVNYLILIVVALAVLDACGSASREEHMVKFIYEDKTFDEIVAMVNDSGKTGLLYFTYEGCTPCKMLEDSVFRNKQAIEYIEANLLPFWIEEGDSAINSDLVTMFQIRGFPTIALISESGEVLNQILGYTPGYAGQYIELIKNAADPANKGQYMWGRP